MYFCLNLKIALSIKKVWVNLREFYVYNGNINKIPAPLKIASKRVCENLFTHKASGSNFNNVNFTA